MQGIMYDHLQRLDKSRSNWRIKVRLTRFWPTYSSETSVLRGYNMILLDDDNSHIHAYVYPDNWRAIGKEVVEGSVYVIENFQVRDTIGRLKPVSNKLCLRLLSTTNIDLHPNDEMIPDHKFEFIDLGDLKEESKRYVNDENPEYAIDLIGVIEGFERVKRIPTKIGERDVVKFKICDGAGLYQNVTVWGDLAAIVSSDYFKQHEKPVIVVLASAKLSTFREYIQLTNIPSTRVYFNLDLEPVNDFRIRLIEIGYKNREGTSDNPINVNESPVLDHVTFKDLIANSESNFARTNVMVTFTVTKIEEEDNWWYYSCTVCHIEVEKVERKFKCQNCKRSYPYSEKRFRILILAEDETCACTVILMDRVVKRIIKTTVANLLNELKKAPSFNVVSEISKDLIGKRVTVNIRLSTENISGNIYEATDICDAPNIHTIMNEKSPSVASSQFSPSGVVHGIELFQTPGSSKSVTKKIKMEDESVEIGTKVDESVEIGTKD